MKSKQIQLSANMSFDIILVEGGKFLMGANDESSSQPIHEVAVESFYLGKCSVTQVLWEEVMGGNPSSFQGENHPVENVSWNDAKSFIDKLNNATSKAFRLPTEAEWEYAARGGRYSQGYTYAGSDKLSQVGWYRENSNDETHEVGLLLPNELGLYDMSGNVWEWCEDDWHDSYEGASVDGSAWVDAPDRGAERVLRGGSCFFSAEGCRPAVRNGDAPDDRYGIIGFRLVLPLQSVG